MHFGRAVIQNGNNALRLHAHARAETLSIQSMLSNRSLFLLSTCIFIYPIARPTGFVCWHSLAFGPCFQRRPSFHKEHGKDRPQNASVCWPIMSFWPWCSLKEKDTHIAPHTGHTNMYARPADRPERQQR